MKNGSLRKISPKRAKLNIEYHRLRKQYLMEHPICEICGKDKAEDIHHTAGKSGSLYLDVSKWKAASRKCHRFLHDNPKWAREHGFLLYGKGLK